jgi:hypothetical protein
LQSLRLCENIVYGFSGVTYVLKKISRWHPVRGILPSGPAA